MSSEPVQHVTELLRAAQAGDAGAAERLLAVVYEQLQEVARARMAHLPPGQTLQPTALVHEAYLRLTDKSTITWESRQHFFFAAARALRDILVEQARAAAKKKCCRDSQLTSLLSVRRRYASWTSAVACNVWPGGRPAMRAQASWCSSW